MENLMRKSGKGLSLPMKIVLGVLMAALLFIPMTMVENLILERSGHHDEVVQSIGKDWGGEQNLQGPFLIVPVKEEKLALTRTYYYEGNVRKSRLENNEVTFTPEELNIKGEVKPVFKHRGIYKYVVYSSDINISGKYPRFDLAELKIKNTALKHEHLDWENARLKFYVSDSKGISGDSKVSWNGKNLELKPTGSQNAQSAFYCPLSIDSLANNTFQAHIKLKGSGALHFIPLGKNTKIQLQTHWASPRFSGYFSPDSSHFDGKVYHSDWSISQLARPIPNTWLSTDEPDYQSYNLGLDMIETVDKYQQTLRSAKYSILFILLSFLILFFSELVAKKPSNMLLYLLTGLALVLFYSLLLSLTEQMSFGLAYLIASASIILLITFYSHSVFRSAKTTSLLFSFWVILYSFLYFILQLEEMALLAGNIGLFIILAVVMYFSRKIKLEYPHTPEAKDEKPEIDNGDFL